MQEEEQLSTQKKAICILGCRWLCQKSLNTKALYSGHKFPQIDSRPQF